MNTHERIKMYWWWW